MSIPINVWTISIAVTVVLWVWFITWDRHQNVTGYGPDIIGFTILVALMAGSVGWWASLILGYFIFK